MEDPLFLGALFGIMGGSLLLSAVENERRKQTVKVCWNEGKFHGEGGIGMALLKTSEIHNFQRRRVPRKYAELGMIFVLMGM